MKNILVLLFCVGILSFSSGNLAASPIYIDNNSFETPDLGEGAPGVPQGAWVVVGFANAWDPWSNAFKYLPDGPQVAYSNGGSLSQTLSDTLTAGLYYKLQVEVGRRWDAPCEGICAPNPGARVELYAGSTLLTSYQSSTDLVAGEWTTVQLFYSPSDNDPALGEQLKIVLSAATPQAHFDNVRLDSSIPEPGAIVLVAAGLLAILAGKRRTAAR